MIAAAGDQFFGGAIAILLGPADFGVGNLVGNFPGCRAFEIQRATEN